MATRRHAEVGEMWEQREIERGNRGGPQGPEERGYEGGGGVVCGVIRMNN